MLDKYNKTALKISVRNLLDIFQAMVSFGPSVRPECSDILDKIDSWSLSKDILKANINEFSLFINQQKSDNSLIYKEIISSVLKIDKMSNVKSSTVPNKKCNYFIYLSIYSINFLLYFVL